MDLLTPYSELAQIFRDHQSFLLLSHIRPDADAVGSEVALGASLKAMGKTVHIWNEDGVPDNLLFMKGMDGVIKSPSEPVEVDVVVSLDTANRPRLGANSITSAEKAKLWVNIDHHKSNDGYGQINHIDVSAPATGQILYELLSSQEMPMPQETVEALYVAISTDTGSFQFPGTTKRTYEIAGKLIERGVDVGEINSLTYDNNPYRVIELTRELLNTLERRGDAVAHWELTREVKEKLGYLPSDSEGLIDMIRGIRGVQVAIFFEELVGGTIRVSMRSKDRSIDVCEICQKFGGGGHALASGIRMDGTLAEAKQAVLKEVDKAVFNRSQA